MSAARVSHVEGAILVGGESKRMGRDKALLRVDGTPLVERVANTLASCFARVSLVGRRGADAPLGLPWLEDQYAQRAPIVGLHAALRACRSSAVFLTACDLPDLDPRVVLALVALVATDGSDEIVVAEGENGPEPLCAIYRPSLLSRVEEQIEKGELSLQSLLGQTNTRFLPANEIRRIDPELRSFRNLNEPEDL